MKPLVVTPKDGSCAQGKGRARFPCLRARASQTTLLAAVPGAHLCGGRHSFPVTSSETVPSSGQNFPPQIPHQQPPFWQTKGGQVRATVL